MYNLPNPQPATEQKLLRNLLGSLLALLAINAFGGGYYGMAGATGVPLEWLAGSPFRGYFIPGLILFVLVGGMALAGAILVFRRHPAARRAALLSGLITATWLGVQVAIIGYVSWMQPATALVTLAILLLAWRLPN